MRKDSLIMYDNDGVEIEVVHTWKDKEYNHNWHIISKHGNLEVTMEGNLHKNIKNTSAYQNKASCLKRMEEEYNKIEENKEKLIKEIQNKAIKAMVARIKLNTLFSDDDNKTKFGITICKELKTLLLEDKETIN